MRELERRDDGYRLHAVDSLDDLDLASLLPMLDEAWEHDYRDEERMAWTEPVLRKLMRARSWVAVLACSPEGAPVGFEVALERTLRVGDRSLAAFYATVFSVAPGHRRRGLGSWVLQGINRQAFEERAAELIISTFHHGHAGSPTVQSTFDRIDDWGVCRFHESPVYGCRLDGELPAVPGGKPEACFLELEERAGGAMLVRPVGEGAREPVIALETVDRMIRDGYPTSFAFEGNLRHQYLNADHSASGTLLVDLGGGVSGLGRGGAALVCFNISPMKYNEISRMPIGQVQLVLAPGCSHQQHARVGRFMAHFLRDRGCFAMSTVDMGMIPSVALEESGYVELPVHVTFAVRGPRANVSLFESIEPPFFVDFA